MRVIRVPVRLRIASWAVLSIVPLVALEWFLIAKTPWWRVSLRPLLWSGVALTCLLSLAAWGLSYGKRWVLFLLLSLAIGWSLGNLMASFSLGQPKLGLFTILQVVSLGVLFSWIRFESESSCFDPQLAWYQGSPRPIPGLLCDIKVGSQTHHFAVTRFDQEGAFVYLNPLDRLNHRLRSGLPPIRKGDLLDLSFRFRDQQLSCQGHPMRLLLDRGAGIGFQFDAVTADLRKELGDFLESLRGEGYV